MGGLGETALLASLRSQNTHDFALGLSTGQQQAGGERQPGPQSFFSQVRACVEIGMWPGSHSFGVDGFIRTKKSILTRPVWVVSLWLPFKPTSGRRPHQNPPSPESNVICSRYLKYHPSNQQNYPSHERNLPVVSWSHDQTWIQINCPTSPF